MFRWFGGGKKDGEGKDKSDPVGVGKMIDNVEQFPVARREEQKRVEKAKQKPKKDSEAERIVNDHKLQKLGISNDLLKVLGKHKIVVLAADLETHTNNLARDAQYEGYAFEVTYESTLQVMIGVHLVSQDQDQKLKELRLFLAKRVISSQEEHRKMVEAEHRLMKAPTHLEVAIAKEAQRIILAEFDNPTPNQAIPQEDIDQAVAFLKKNAYRVKALRICQEQAVFDLRKLVKDQSFSKTKDVYKEAALRLIHAHMAGIREELKKIPAEEAEKISPLIDEYLQKIPVEEANKLVKLYYDDYVKTHPFKS
jgi:hypothetical protein